MGTKKKEALIKFNKNNIITAAKKLFEIKGIDMTTVDDIAKEADYSKSTLYVYFKGKDEILDYILLEQFIKLRDKFKEVIDNKKNTEECITILCESIIDIMHENPMYYKKMFMQIKLCEKDFEEKNVKYQIYQVGEEINNMIASQLKVGIEEKIFREDIQIIPTVFYLWSGISSIISFADEKEQYLKMRLDMTKDDYMKYCFELIIKSIRK